MVVPAVDWALFRDPAGLFLWVSEKVVYIGRGTRQLIWHLGRGRADPPGGPSPRAVSPRFISDRWEAGLFNELIN